jgi:ribosomal protein S18 acetylase RimI-like enzyme
MTAPDFVLNSPVTLRDGRTVTLRPATPADAEGLREIRRQVILEDVANADNRVPTTEQIAEEITKTNAAGLMLIADFNGHAVGLVKLQRTPFAYMQHHLFLSVELHADFRGGGLGAYMLNHAAAWSRHYDYEFIRLGVFSSNPRAEALYRRLGYREYGRLPHFIKRPDGSYADSIEMVLEL